MKNVEKSIKHKHFREISRVFDKEPIA